MKHISFTKFLFSVLLVGIGILLLLINTKIISLDLNTAIATYYPILFIVIGIWMLFEPLFSHRRIHWFWSLLFLIVGSLLLADRFGVVTFHLSMIWQLWPLLLVYIGLEALLKGSRRHHRKKKNHVHVDKTSKYHGSTIFRLVTDVTKNKPNWPVEDLDAWFMVADYDLDFTQAFIPDKETTITLNGWVGDIKLVIPEDVPFSIDGYANVGDIKISGVEEDGIGKAIHYKTTDYDEATRKLTFHCNFKVLDLRVDRV